MADEACLSSATFTDDRSIHLSMLHARLSRNEDVKSSSIWGALDMPAAGGIDNRASKPEIVNWHVMAKLSESEDIIDHFLAKHRVKPETQIHHRRRCHCRLFIGRMPAADTQGRQDFNKIEARCHGVRHLADYERVALAMSIMTTRYHRWRSSAVRQYLNANGAGWVLMRSA